MSSNRIYGTLPPLNLYGPFHYLYRITNIVEQKYYYGIRTPPKNITPQEDLGIKYFSSSKDKYFREDQKKHPQNYKYKIVAIKKTRKEIVNLEIFLHEKFNVGLNSKFYNRSKQTSNGYDATGKIPVKDIFGNIFQVTTNDIRLLSGELVHFTKNTICVKDAAGKFFRVASDDPKYLSGELVGSTKGIKPKKKLCIYCGGTFAVGPFKLFHGENCIHNNNNHHKKFTIKINTIEKECEYCGKMCNVGNYTRWHGNKCKFSPVVFAG